MVVAVVAVGMVQPATDQIIHMIPVRNGLMSALWPMHMLGIMAVAAVRAFVRIDVAHCNDVFVHMLFMDVMEMAVMQIILMTLMFDYGVATAWAVLMGMILMLFTITHIRLSFLSQRI